MTDVIKSDERREPFNAEKVRKSIESAAREADITEERTKEIVEKVSRKVTKMAEQGSEIETRAIREAILTELDATEPAVSEAWRKFDETKATQ
jgi:transcriptional repressor NrdR